MENLQQQYYGYIYLTENLVNGKKYIGMHKSPIFDHNYYGTGKLIKQALLKYGKDQFKCIILEWGYNKADLQQKEKAWINKYNAVNNPDFYNISKGGTGDFDRALETKHKLHNWLLGDSNPAKRPEVREKIRLSKLGNKNPMKREEVRLKVKNSLKDYKVQPTSAWHPVFNLTTGEKYQSSKAAARALNVTPASITQCCQENLLREPSFYRTIKNNILLYSSEVQINQEAPNFKKLKETINQKKKNQRFGKSKKRKVINLTTGKIYESIMAAERDTGCSNSLIYLCCQGKRKMTQKQKWAYYE